MFNESKQQNKLERSEYGACGEQLFLGIGLQAWPR